VGALQWLIARNQLRSVFTVGLSPFIAAALPAGPGIDIVAAYTTVTRDQQHRGQHGPGDVSC